MASLAWPRGTLLFYAAQVGVPFRVYAVVCGVRVVLIAYASTRIDMFRPTPRVSEWESES